MVSRGIFRGGWIEAPGHQSICASVGSAPSMRVVAPTLVNGGESPFDKHPKTRHTPRLARIRPGALPGASGRTRRAQIYP